MKIPQSFEFMAAGLKYRAVINKSERVDVHLLLAGWSYSLEDANELLESGHWTIITKDTNAPQETFLDRVKEFTRVTNASVFIIDGEYEIYYDDANNPAKASTDEDMEKLMNAIVVLNEASY